MPSSFVVGTSGRDFMRSGAASLVCELADGQTFPMHTHRGEEVSVIILGQLRDGEGRILSTGDELVQPAGSTHQITAVGGECIFAARAMLGIEIGGAPVGPKAGQR